jgi:hypothetical protein
MAKLSDLMAMYRAELDRKDSLVVAHKAELAEVDDRLTRLSAAIKITADKNGLETVKVDGVGTATWKINRNVSIADSGEFFQYVKEHDRFDLLQKRISNTAALELYDQGNPVPGTTVYAESKLSFRRSN